ncbi:MAG: cytidylyltransferase domain-containing protein [Nitrosarchaeum sp.]
MKPICFIAARGGSKGVPRKNIRKLAGKPLIAHTIESSLKSNIFSHVVVSTEDKEIASIAKKYGAEVPFLRPRSLATNTASMIDVIKHGIKSLNSLDYKFDIIVNRDCTVPFIRTKDVANSIKLLKKQKCDAVFCAYKQHLNPYFNMMEINSKGFLKFVKAHTKRPQRRQDAPVVYQLNGVFVYNVNKFLKYGTFPPKSLPYEIPPETGLMIDTKFEFKMAELIIKNKLL